MTTITCVGVAVRDIIFSLPHLPTAPGKYHASDRIEVGGGVAANAAVAIARLGGEARHVGAVGNDALGQLIIDDLEREGVDTSRVRSVSGVPSPLSAVVVDGAGERFIVNHTDQRLFDRAMRVDDNDLEGSDAVLADVRWPAASAVALEWAANSGKPGVLDFDVGTHPADGLIDLASHVVFSSDALTRLVGSDDARDALTEVSSRTETWVAVTVGAEGTYWIEDNALVHEPSFEVEVVDTTGAGDVYHGALALGLGNGETSFRDTVRFASAAAAITCTTFGGRSGIPTATEVEEFLEVAR